MDQVTGESVGRHDDWADRQHGFWLFGPDYTPIFRQRMSITPSLEAPANRALWVVFSLWKKKGGQYVRHEILESDRRLLSEKQVILDELVLLAPVSASTKAPLARYDNGFALAAVELPESAAPGDALPITFSWRSSAQGSEDLVQFLHFQNAESLEWIIYDQEPLGARLPTRLWYAGLDDRETWNVPLPADLAPGAYRVFTGLYRLSDQRRIPATLADGTRISDASLGLGELIVRSG